MKPTRPLYHRIQAHLGQEMPHPDTPMPMVEVLPEKEFEQLLEEVLPLTGRLKRELPSTALGRPIMKEGGER